MEAKILNEKDAALLDRKEIVLEFSYPGLKTPSRAEVLKKAAELLKKEENLIEFKKISSIFGLGKCRALIHVYKDVNDLNRIEKIKKKVKKAAEPAPQQKK
mgnify:CR=1 FL=1